MTVTLDSMPLHTLQCTGNLLVKSGQDWVKEGKKYHDPKFNFRAAVIFNI